MLSKRNRVSYDSESFQRYSKAWPLYTIRDTNVMQNLDASFKKFRKTENVILSLCRKFLNYKLDKELLSQIKSNFLEERIFTSHPRCNHQVKC